MLEQDEEVLVWMPHTHVRGRGFKYEAIYPDGKKEVLLDVPKYDFNWQNSYVLAEPKLLPKGTTLRCEAHYNNSDVQPGQPRSDPGRPLGRTDLGRDDDRLLRPHAASGRSHQEPRAHPQSNCTQAAAAARPRAGPSWLHAALDRRRRLTRSRRPCTRNCRRSIASASPACRMATTSSSDPRTPASRSSTSPRPASKRRPGWFRSPASPLFNRVVSLPDLTALGSAPSMKMITDAHQIECPRPGVFGRSAKQCELLDAGEKAFPEETLAMLQSLAAEVASKK